MHYNNMNASENRDISNGDTKTMNSKFTKSLSNFKTTKKNFTNSQNPPSSKYTNSTVKNSKSLKDSKSLKSVKSKRVSLSNQKTKSTEHFILSTEANPQPLSDCHTPLYSVNYNNTNSNSINNTNTNSNNQNNGGNISNNSENKVNGGDNTLLQGLQGNISNNNIMNGNKSINNNTNNTVNKNNRSGTNNVSNNSENSNKNTNTKNQSSKRFKDKNNNNIAQNKKTNIPKVKTNNFTNLKNNTKSIKNKSKPINTFTTQKSKGIDTNNTNIVSKNNNKKDKKLATNDKQNKINQYSNKNPKNSKIYIESNENETDLLANKYKFYQTVDENDLESKNSLGNLLNTLPNKFSNNRNEKKGLNPIKTLNSMKSYQQELDTNFNKTSDINDNSSIDINKKKSDKINNLASQTYSGPFHNNKNNALIKVNIIENNTESNLLNYNGVAYSNRKSTTKKNINIINTNINITKSIINSGLKNNAKKNLYIETDFQIKSKKNKLLNSKKNTEPNIKIKNDKKPNNDNFVYKSQFGSINSSKECPNYKKSTNTLYTTNNISTSMDGKIFPLSRDNSKAYIKKKTSNMNFNGKKNDFKNNTNRNNLIEKKFLSPDSCYNTQRINKPNLLEDDDNEYYNYNITNFNSPRIHKTNTKFNDNQKIMKMPEYRYKLEKIKSRVINLLEVYSLLALKTISINGKENNNS